MLSFPKRSIRALEDLTPGAHNSSPADALISELGRKKLPSHSFIGINGIISNCSSGLEALSIPVSGVEVELSLDGDADFELEAPEAPEGFQKGDILTPFQN